MRETRSIPIVAVLLAGFAAAPVPGAAQQTSPFRWSGSLAAGSTVEIIGLNGDIEAVPASGNEVQVEAVKRAREHDPEAVRIEVVEHEGGVRICAVYPLRSGERNEGCGNSGGDHGELAESDVQVAFTVRVPAGVAFTGRTVNGGIEASELRGDVHASTVNGGVRVSGAGRVEAQSVNGAIEAALGRGVWEGTLEMETVNGSITVRLPADASASIVAQTVNGELNSDFPLTIDAGERWGPRRIEGTIGSGGGTLELKTVNGSIRIVREGV